MKKSAPTYIGFDEIMKREIYCLSASALGELPGPVLIPGKHLVILLVADTTRDDVTVLGRFAEGLLGAGCVYFSVWGPGCERMHDVMDECSFHREPEVMTTWHAEESLDEALLYFLRCTWPDEGFLGLECSAVVITVGSTDWAEHVERRLRDRRSLINDLLQ